jgi:hypothetical protein
MTDEAPTPEEGPTRVVNEELQQWDGTKWVPFPFLAQAGSGGDGKPLVIYKIVSDDKAGE